MKSTLVPENMKSWMNILCVFPVLSVLNVVFYGNKKSPHASYLSSEAEAAFGLHHLLQNVALDACSTDILIDNAVLQMDVIYRHADQRPIIGEGKSAQSVVCGELSPVSVCTLHALRGYDVHLMCSLKISVFNLVDREDTYILHLKIIIIIGGDKAKKVMSIAINLYTQC